MSEDRQLSLNSETKDPNIDDIIITKPKTMGVIPMEKQSLMKEYKSIISSLQYHYLTAKEIHQKKYADKSERTVYRYINKLLEEGLIIEVGIRRTKGSRVTEALYGAFAKVIFFEGPEVMQEWETENGRRQMHLMYLLFQQKVGKPVDFDEFEKFALRYLKAQDDISSELIRFADDPEILEALQEIQTGKISHLLFYASNIAIMAEAEKKFFGS